MPLRNPQKFLYDIINCCEFVLEMTKGKTVEDYKSNRIFRSALERELQIIGEAMLQLDNTYPEISEQIAQHRSIIGFRHVLVHGYASLDPDTVWNVVETKIATLLQQSQKLLKNL
jgi:uncharacterized protein with HEPN domain